MSQENVEIVRRAFAQFEKGNFWVPGLFDPDVRVRWLDVVGMRSETVGLQNMSDFMKTWFEVHENLTMTAERLIDAGDQVVVFAAWHGRGRASGASTDWPHAAVWTLRNAKVISIEGYSDRASAPEAAGLSE